jgi:hypothetical protein
MTLILELSTLRYKTLAALTAAVLEDPATGFRGHAGAETMLADPAAS